jgi:hypothetical protein
MITKRQLGFGILILGIFGAIGLLAVDFVGAGDFDGIGPAQRIGLILAGFAIIVGATLLPLGHKPA